MDSLFYFAEGALADCFAYYEITDFFATGSHLHQSYQWVSSKNMFFCDYYKFKPTILSDPITNLLAFIYSSLLKLISGNNNKK